MNKSKLGEPSGMTKKTSIGDTLLSEGAEIACGLQKADESADPGEGYDCNLYSEEFDCFEQAEQEESTSSDESQAQVDRAGRRYRALAENRFITRNRSQVDELTERSSKFFDIHKNQKEILKKLGETPEPLTIQQITNSSSFAEAGRNFLSVLHLAQEGKVEMNFDPVRRGQPIERFRVQLPDSLNDDST